MSEAQKNKPRKIILMGRSECGKTTLLQAMHKEEIRYHKTQEIIQYDDAIDTPGEYRPKRTLESLHNRRMRCRHYCSCARCGQYDGAFAGCVQHDLCKTDNRRNNKN